MGLLVIAPVASGAGSGARFRDSIPEGNSFSSEKHRSHARGAYLPPAPRADPNALEGANIDGVAARADRKANQSSFTRAQVVALHNTLYVPGNSAAMGWTGVVPPTCTPGTTNATYRQATLDRINFYRQISGLPMITFFAPSDTTGLNAQASALMQGANSWAPPVNAHSPPNSWTCYTSGGAAAAGSSNLAKGGAGPVAIDLYMDDFGASNLEVGHRRWLLYPRFIKSFSGDVPSGSGITSANDLVVFGAGTHGSRPAMPDGVAWPPGGFVPYQALPDVSNRWSFHWPGANFAVASASITKNGQSVAILGYDARDGDGFGDAAIVFRPNNVSANGPFVSYASPGAVDQPYEVTVSGMTGGGVPASVTYTVTVIDPAVSPTVAISGSATLSPSGNADPGTPVCINGTPGGASCNNVDGSGQYSCTVPTGWTGSIHLQVENTKRVPARRYTSAVTAAETGQNFVVFDANNATLTCNLDIDNNGLLDEEIDGVMILRKLFGVSGTEQAVSGSGVCAQRTSVADKANFLALQDFDVNNNVGLGARAPHDGLVLVRLMLGVSGATAVAGTGLNWANVQPIINAKCGTNF